jgi:hypothetical protein
VVNEIFSMWRYKVMKNKIIKYLASLIFTILAFAVFYIFFKVMDLSVYCIGEMWTAAIVIFIISICLYKVSEKR